eukprot:6348478-Prorocentrum_lima.AAC.1
MGSVPRHVLQSGFYEEPTVRRYVDPLSALATGVCVFNEPDWDTWTNDSNGSYVPDPDDGTFEVPDDYVPSTYTYGKRP